MYRYRVSFSGLLILPLILLLSSPAIAAAPGVGNVPQGTQGDSAYAGSFAAHGVTNVAATTQRVSCYRPEVPYITNIGPNDGYSGMSPCPSATTGENIGASPYPSQDGSNPGYPAGSPQRAKGFSESDLRVDPTNPNHLVGSSKWFVSAEGYNHLLGFYESFDGGRTWPVQGHIPGYEGWTDNTDPVGAFDGYGNYYALILPYQFFYNDDGTHNFATNPNKEPNPSQAAEVIAIAVRKHGAVGANDWSTANGQRDIIAPYDNRGNEPDKQWITIDTNPASPHYNTIYAMWVDFNGPFGSKPFLSTAKALADGTHTPWSTPQRLPTVSATASDTYLLPHVDPSGIVWTPVANFPSAQQRTTAGISVISSADGGQTWHGPFIVVQNIQLPPFRYPNTTFRDGIVDTFAVGARLSTQHQYPLYLAWEDASAGTTNVLLSASYDGGQHWTPPIQVNDNVMSVDAFQPNLAVATDGSVSVAFYDRRLACPTGGTSEAAGAGIALDRANPAYTGSLPPYGAANYCVNASVQFYSATLAPKGHNIRLTQHTWDPQLNAPHTSCATCVTTFIGDYFGNVTSGTMNISTFVSTYDDGGNPNHTQQQVIATVAIP